MRFKLKQPLFKLLLLSILLSARVGMAEEALITTAQAKDGAAIAYILNYNNLSPQYLLILFPGGTGMVNPHMEEGKLVYGFRGNFLLRARTFIVDDEFATATTNSTQVEEHIQAVIDDLKKRFPAAKIYLVGTSNGTFDTMKLAEYLADKIAGEIHTSSLRKIASFDARKFANRNLVVHHRNDSCKATPFASAEQSHARYGTELIIMEGGINVGDPCEPFAHHGYNGIERETVDAIKGWIEQGR